METLHNKKKLAAGTLAGLLTGLCAMAQVQAPAPVSNHVPEADVRPDTEIVAEQYLLLGNATRGSGESQVAVNPLNPNQIVVAAMSVMHNNEGKFEHNELEFQRTYRATITQFAISRDRGLTWTVMEDPMRSYFHRYRCLDPFADFAADGTMLLGCEAHFPVSLGPQEQIDAALYNSRANFGGVDMITSTDGGRTFSEPVEVISSYMPKEIFGPFVSFSSTGPAGDAPKIKVDRSTGKIYIGGNSTAAEPQHPQTVIRMSRDRGRNWGMVYAADSADWPNGRASFDAPYDVTNGVVAVLYTASQVPATLNTKCPCMVFGTSKDDGKTFERHIVPTTQANPLGALFADPGKAGRFVILSQAGDHFEANLTEDSGINWTGFKSLGAVKGPAGFNVTATNIAARYSERGELLVSWRAVYHDPKEPPRVPGSRTPVHVFGSNADPSEIWSVLSRDGGRTFSTPLKVSTALSPGLTQRRSNSGHSADYISVALDHDFAHMSWFDTRTGFLGTWYGRVPLKDFK